MTKSDLISALSTKENLTEKDASEIVNLIFDGFANELKNGGRIEIRGFGSFIVREYDGYMGKESEDWEKDRSETEEIAVFQSG